MAAVFGVSVSTPIFIFNQLKYSADNVLIKQSLEVIKNWAEIDKVKRDSYAFIESDPEIIKKKGEIKKLGSAAEMHIGLNGKSFCAKVNFIGIQKNRLWCVDSSGYSGAVGQNCRPGNNPQCR
ncbi:MAG: hypothetical protein WC470_01415 [Candidatus Paceibacterota bacterium]